MDRQAKQNKRTDGPTDGPMAMDIPTNRLPKSNRKKRVKVSNGQANRLADTHRLTDRLEDEK